MDQNIYHIPAQTRIGHVHLEVSDLQRALMFYQELLGFELVATYLLALARCDRICNKC